jgi:hypothetical protein
MNREELISVIKASIAKSASLLNTLETRIEELEKNDDLGFFFVATDQISIALEQVHVGIDRAVSDQGDAEIISIIGRPSVMHRSRLRQLCDYTEFSLLNGEERRVCVSLETSPYISTQEGDDKVYHFCKNHIPHTKNLKRITPEEALVFEVLKE